MLNLDLTGCTELVNSCVLELKTEVRGDHCAACEGSDILEHILASVAEARCLDSNTCEGAAELVEYESCERLTLNVLGDDKELSAGLYDSFEKRQDFLSGGDLLVCNENERIVELGNHLVGICYHVGSNVASVER